MERDDISRKAYEWDKIDFMVLLISLPVYRTLLMNVSAVQIHLGFKSNNLFPFILLTVSFVNC